MSRAKYTEVSFGNHVSVTVWDYGRLDLIEICQDPYEAHCLFDLAEAKATAESLLKAIAFYEAEQAKIATAERSGEKYELLLVEAPKEEES